MRKPKIAIILGTRPEIIKLSSVIRELNNQKANFFIVHTNQHFDANMDRIFFEELELPQPKYNLNISKEKTHGAMTGKMIIEIEKIILKEKPSLVIIQGDTNTTLAGALTGAKLGIKIAHVEAGLRSYDRTMPEEINRVVTDHLSDYLFAPTINQKKILIEEGIDQKKIFVVGNTIVDAVLQNLKIAKKNQKYIKYKSEKYFLLTLHRPSNVDNENQLKKIIGFLEKISKVFQTKFYFPMHPRTREKLAQFKIMLNSNFFKITAPVGYLEMLLMEKYTKAIFTDSGGLQEEACILKVPCITLRQNTERPETIEVGANILVYDYSQKDLEKIKLLINKEKKWKNPYGTGKSGKMIVDNLINLNN